MTPTYPWALTPEIRLGTHIAISVIIDTVFKKTVMGTEPTVLQMLARHSTNEQHPHLFV